MRKQWEKHLNCSRLHFVFTLPISFLQFFEGTMYQRVIKKTGSIIVTESDTGKEIVNMPMEFWEYEFSKNGQLFVLLYSEKMKSLSYLKDDVRIHLSEHIGLTDEDQINFMYNFFDDFHEKVVINQKERRGE